MEIKLIFYNQNDGQIDEAHSISAGLDYPGIGLNTHIYLNKKELSICQQQIKKQLKHLNIVAT